MRRAYLLGQALGAAAVFLVSLVGGALAHADLPAVRRVVAERVNEALAHALPGRIVVERVGSLGSTHVGDVDARVQDPDGTTVLRLAKVNARISTVTLLRSLLFGPATRVELSELSVQRADVNIDADALGDLHLVRAFVTTTPGTGTSREVRVTIPRAHVAHATVHGRPTGGPVIDADVDDLDAALRLGAEALGIDVMHASIVARNVVGKVGAKGEVEGYLSRPSGSNLGGRVTWDGSLGPVSGSASASYDGRVLDVVVDVARCAPEDVRALWESCPFTDAATVHLEVHGTLPAVSIAARASVGRSAVTLGGPVTLGDETHASLHFEASSVDAHAFAPSAPASDVSAAGDAVLTFFPSKGSLESVFALEFAGGTVRSTAIPSATVHGEVSADTAGVLAKADVAVHEPGAPAEAKVRLASGPSGTSIGWDASVDIPRLGGVPRLEGIGSGHARATSRGTIDLATSRVDAELDAIAGDLAIRGVTLRSLTSKVHARGPIAMPWIDASCDGQILEGEGLTFATAHLEAHGSPANAQVVAALGGAGTRVNAQADVGIIGGTTFRNVNAAVERESIVASVRVALVRIAGAEIRIDDATIAGLGSPIYATVRASPAELVVHAEGRGVDLARIARIARKPSFMEGRLSIGADATIRRSGALGHVVLDLAKGTIDRWRNVGCHLDATLDGRRARGEFTASVADIGWVQLQSNSIEVGGAGPLVLASWRNAWGAIDLKGHVELAKLAAQLPGEARLRELAGTVDVTSRAARDDADDVTPDVDLRVRTSGIVATGGSSSAPWRLAGIDATAHLAVDGGTGFSTLDAQLVDSKGVLAVLAATSDAVPYAPLFLTDQPILDIARAIPFDAKLTIPARDLASLPAIAGLRGMHGELTASAQWNGPLLRPTLDVQAKAVRLASDAAVLARPIDVDATGHYDGTRADATLHASSRSKQVLVASARIEVSAVDLLDRPGGVLPWTASGHATLSGFPLQSIAMLDDRRVRGHASGELTIDGLHDDAHATLALRTEDLRVAEIACRSATVQASIGSEADVTVHVEQDDGYAEAHAQFGTLWGAAMAPSVDASKEASLSLLSKQLRAELLLPFLSHDFTELQGRLDTDMRLTIGPNGTWVRPDGIVSLRDATFQLASAGGELHDARATLTATPDGLVHLRDASARGVTGEIQAAATARFIAGVFSGARAVVQVPKLQPLPLVVDGVQVGVFDGQMTLAVDPAKNGSDLDVKVDLPTAHVELPQASTHDVQTLDDLPGMRIGYELPGQGWVSLQNKSDDSVAVTAKARRRVLHVVIRLGGDVEVRRGSDLDVRLEGAPTFTVEQAIRASGQIRLVRGTLDVQGKRFTIEDGSVTFEGDATNPQVKLRASWQAPDGTIIYASFVGPLKTGSVTLSSDPTRTQTEILSLVLFGTADQGQQAATATGSSTQAYGAAGAAGGAATAPINRALGGVNQMLDSFGLAGGISTKIDTSQTTPRPEVEIQIARDISLQVAWVLGAISPGSNPDTTLFTLDWRFLRNLSLETTVGDQGTSILDLVWQHRY